MSDKNVNETETPAKPIEKAAEKLFKQEKLEKIEHKEKPEKIEHKEKPEKHEHKEKPEKIEHKEKPEKHEHKEKPEKHEHKEILKIEHKEKESLKIELPEKRLGKEKDGKELAEGHIGDPGDPIEQRLAALEQGLAAVHHFITTGQRPDLSRGALASEPDKKKP
jgi:hypothetical protein